MLTLYVLITPMTLDQLFLEEEIETATEMANSDDPAHADWGLMLLELLAEEWASADHPYTAQIENEIRKIIEEIETRLWLGEEVLYNGLPLCHINQPEEPWDGYPVPDAVSAEAGLIPAQVRERSRTLKKNCIHGSTRGRRYYPYH